MSAHREDNRPILVTGGAGFIGSNLADRLAEEGHVVIVYDALLRTGVERNLAWLQSRHGERIRPLIGDVQDAGLLAEAVGRSRAVFHLAAQVAVTTSLADPRQDFEVNLGGTFNLLEAVRRNPVPVVFASTNKVYGDLADLEFTASRDGYLPTDEAFRTHGIGEARPLDFHTPYGCSKGAADQYVLDYARSYGVPAAVLRMSCIYGQRQMGTEDQGWVAHFLIRALEGEAITLYGDGQQVRDILEVGDAVAAYIAAWDRIDRVAGRAFNLGGGTDNAVSLRTLLDYIGHLVGTPPQVRCDEWRAGDQRYFVADTRAAAKALGLARPLPWREGVERLTRWLATERGLDTTLDETPQPVPARTAAL
ncbi:NAD-dependent epimerase/dehydratase family protein [Novosphingobium resinovorum]|uniref:NAD-dependent epimerase/dehydratase family protein n=1 Tax=Novosphingobium TaxID=165696 RepID=UPI001B3C962C|nr:MULTISPECIES: NAD-dependent epimerase/dehydratase family protein [Novosphingobium]MBF7013819.1 NAD-dependent epimerase/dehydratase family protein [Novosphingobium sp. HR1a]WJM25963.1 NAD-dependent epimerase/dehydratase family protein [Novosphingobium resinovorum]